jgi:hypothetical protein
MFFPFLRFTRYKKGVPYSAAKKLYKKIQYFKKLSLKNARGKSKISSPHPPRW